MIVLDELAEVTPEQWERLVRERPGERAKRLRDEEADREEASHPERRTFGGGRQRENEERERQLEAEAAIAKEEARARRRRSRQR